MMRKARERVGLPGPVGEVIILSGVDADTPGDNLDENEDCKIYCLGLSPCYASHSTHLQIIVGVNHGYQALLEFNKFSLSRSYVTWNRELSLKH